MFGDIELKAQRFLVGNYQIELEEKGDIIIYKRDEVRRIIKKGEETPRILPSPAVGYGVDLMMLKLKEPIVVPPKNVLTGFVEAPIEVDIKVGELIIDHFNIGREKYALYGTVDVGVITRYHVSDFHLEEPKALGTAKIIVSNPSKDWKMLERIVFPIKNSVMFYSNDKAYYPLLVVTIKNNILEVNNTGKPPKEGLNATMELLALPNFLMRW